MKSKLIFPIVFLLAVVTAKAIAQKPLAVVDSLQMELSKAANDTARSLIMAELAFRYYTIPDSMRAIAQRGLALGKLISSDRAVAANLVSMVAYYGNIGDNYKGLKLAGETIRFVKKLGDKYLLGRLYMHTAVIYSRSGDPVKSLADFKEALNMILQVNDHHLISLAYNNVGYSYFILGKYDSSKLYLMEGMRVAKLHAPQNLYVLLGSLAELSEKKGEYKKALDYLQESIKLNKDADIDISSDNYLQLARLSLRLNDIENAFLFGEESFRLAEKANLFFRIKPAAELLSNLYEREGQFQKASLYLKRNLIASDSIYALAKRKELNEIKHKFENESREAQIIILQQENALRKINLARQEEKISQQRAVLAIAIFLVALLAALLFSLRSQSLARKNYIQIIEGNQNEIEKKASELSGLNKQLMALNETLELKANEKAQQLIANEEKIRRYAFLNSHHLRGPVATILGIAHLIESGYVEESEQNDLLGKAITEIKKIDGVVKEITQAID